MVGVVANLFAYLKRCKCPSRDQALKNSLIVSTRADLLLITLANCCYASRDQICTSACAAWLYCTPV